MMFASRAADKRDTARKKNKNKKSANKLRRSDASRETLPSKKSGAARSQDDDAVAPPPLPPRPQPHAAAQRNAASTPDVSSRRPPQPIELHFPAHDPRNRCAGRRTSEYVHQGTALADRISDQMNHMLTAMDREDVPARAHAVTQRGVAEERRRGHAQAVACPDGGSKLPSSSSHFAKVWAYANARLPPHLPPLKLYLSTYPLLCLCATHALAVYAPPPPPPSQPPPARTTSLISTTQHIPSSLRTGAKAMTIATATHDTATTSPLILIAIRGTATFIDWAINAHQAPTPPTHFLPDEGNLCHAGFLAVVRRMVPPLAAHLRTLLDAKPARANASVVFTGHSAGGAVASLLYMHCLSTTHASPLVEITAAFKRVHCITFGAPPVSLLPLQKPPASANPRVAHSLFLSFVNEGDPIVRADPAYLKSLLCLYTTPLPPPTTKPVWPVPSAALSNAGRLVLLRSRSRPRVSTGATSGRNKKSTGSTASLGTGGAEAQDETIEAVTVSDGELRGVVFGDVGMHGMGVYVRRVEALAVEAVTAGGGGGGGGNGVT